MNIFQTPPTEGILVSDPTVDGGGIRTYARRVVVGSAAASAAVCTIPAGARVLRCATRVYAAVTLATATQYAIGSAAMPSLYHISTATMTAATLNKWQAGPGTLLGFAPTVASDALSNSTSATSFAYSGLTLPSIPANFLKPGDCIDIGHQGICTATNSTDTFAVKSFLSAGATTTAGAYPTSVIAAVDAVDNHTWHSDATATIRAIGASGTYVAKAWQSILAAGKSDGSSAVTARSEFQASTAIDTTAAIVPGVKGTWSVASASNSCRVDCFDWKVRRPGEMYTTADTAILLAAVSNAGIAAGTLVGTVDVFIQWIGEDDDLPASGTPTFAYAA